MAYAIVQVDSRSAKELAAWDWAALLDEDFDAVRVDTFETAEDLEAAVTAAVKVKQD